MVLRSIERLSGQRMIPRLRLRLNLAVLVGLTASLVAGAPGVYAAPVPTPQPLHTSSDIAINNPAVHSVNPPTPPFTPTAPIVGSMLITGPLDDYEQECFGCADPWAANHSINGMTAFSPDPPAIDAPHPSSLALATTGAPTFQVHVEFDSNGSSPGATDTPFPGVFAVRHGDVANFDATLERCDAPQTMSSGAPPPPGPDCSDYAGSPGNWQQAGSNAVAIGLPSPNAAGQATLQLADSKAFDLGALDLARTYHVRLHEYLQQTPFDVTTVGNTTTADDTRYSLPFDVALSPAMLYQGKVLPYTILYQPTGDLSSPSFTLSTAYGTQFTAGGSTTVSNSMSDTQSSAIDTALRIGFDLQVDTPLNVQFGGGVDVGSSQFWDKTTQLGLGTTATTSSTQSSGEATSITWSHPANVHLVPGAGQMCAVTVPPGVTNPPFISTTVHRPRAPALKCPASPSRSSPSGRTSSCSW